jgi:YjbE family integral membrane protein
MDLELLAKIAQIVAIDIILSGDNAVVIAMAARKLPLEQRRRAIFGGGAIAIVLRILFTLLMAFLLMIPGVRLIGGIVLVWITLKLLLDQGETEEIATAGSSKSMWAAIRMIFVADFVMSLDNMLAVAGAGGEDWRLLVLGLLVSIGIIMFFSSLIARWMNRYPVIVYGGAAILAFTAGEMIMGDREVAHYFASHHRVSLNSHWERDFMLTKEKVASFQCAGALPQDLADVAKYRAGQLEFIGQMTEKQRDSLLECVKSDEDKQAINTIYEKSHARPVPDWVPNGLKARAEPWFQRRWPAEVWKGVQGRQYHYVARVWYALVIAFCMTSPWWSRRRQAVPATGDTKPETVKQN